MNCATGSNLYARLAASFATDAPCVETRDGRLFTYGEAQAASAQAAHALTSLGLVPGDRVAVIAEKSAALVWLYLGCLRAGLVYQPLNTTYSERELAFFFGDGGARLIVHDPALAARVASACAGLEPKPACTTLDAVGEGEFTQRCATASREFATVARQGKDCAALLYSSGTTGTPKGIPLTHDNLFSNARALATAWAFSRDDVLVHALPLFHVHGLFIILHPALLAGSCVRLLPRFEVAAVRAALRGATVMAGVPTYYSRLLAEPTFGQVDCASLRLFISGSAPLLESTFKEFANRTGHTILERYGMTETGINTANPLRGARKAGTVGVPLPGIDVRVVDADGCELASGEVGEIEVRGDNVFGAYWRLPAQSAAAFSADGYFRTGDQGRFDADGYLAIVGRSKDLIISGGLNVYPREIEHEIEELPGVAEAAVFGVPHADFGEAVVAAVVLAAGGMFDQDGAQAHLRRRLAGYKLPKRLLVVEDLPRNTLGKVQKNRLREDYRDLFVDAATHHDSL